MNGPVSPRRDILRDWTRTVIITGPSCVLFTVLKKLGFVILAEHPPRGAKVLYEPRDSNSTRFGLTKSQNHRRKSTGFLPSRVSHSVP